MTVATQQLPVGDDIFLDHVGFFVQDIDAVGDGFQRLGFTVTPVNTHYNADARGGLTKSGTANRLCTFRRGYIEVLGAVAQTPLAAQLNSALDRYSGLHLIAFTHPRVDTQPTRLRQAGFDLQPTVRLRRPVETPEGEKTVQATVVRTAPGVMEEGRVQMLTHETPELIWLPGYAEHQNAADELTDLLILSENPAGKAERYARFANGSVRTEGDIHTVLLNRGRMTFASPETGEAVLPELAIPALPYIAAVGICSSDLKKTRTALKAGGVTPAVETDQVVCVHPEDGMGAYMVFHTAEAGNIGPLLK